MTWDLTGIVKLWWENLSDTEKEHILDDTDPLEALFQALAHEFLGGFPPDASHTTHMFMPQKLYNIDLLQDYFCSMQSILYKFN